MKPPTVHLNGTSKDALLQAAIDAKDAVDVARDKLRACYPNGRDYYVQDTSPGSGVAHRIAVDEYLSMDAKLVAVEEELQQLAQAIADQ